MAPPPTPSLLHRSLHRLRLRLAEVDALPQLALLGIIAGGLSGGVIILFRLLVESSQAGFLPDGLAENYEALPPAARFALPAAGGLLVGLLLQLLKPAQRQVGVAHVMERLAYHQGHLPAINALSQFIGAAISIISGNSVGREGPSVHLGATSASLVGQWLRLPNNSIRTLVACGVAGAIAASFNTPLAGVIFAMEVVMMEYTLTGFAPVIVAAVSATTLTRVVFGSAPAFTVPALQLGSLMELPYVMLIGLVLGGLAAAFIQLLQWFTALQADRPVWLRCTVGGSLVGLCALLVPEVMGIGYDTVEQALLGQIGISLLLMVVAFKLLATTAGLGLGLPGGLIGPTLVIGAAAGGAMGGMGQAWAPEQFSSPAFYAMLGMGGMMGATLQAPLAALTAMLELTGNPNIILPGMLVLIIAGLVSKEVFGKDSVFIELMRARGMDYRNDPVMQALRRQGVASAMERELAVLPRELNRERAESELAAQPHWLLMREEEGITTLMVAADLARFLTENPDTDNIDLREIPAQRYSSVAVNLQANLQQALEILDKRGVEALHVVQPAAPGIERVLGVLTRHKLEASYRY